MRQSQGLSLIEVLVAFSIISIVFLALAMSQVVGFRTTQDSLEASSARDLAARQIEVIRGYGYAVYGPRTGYTGCNSETSAPAGSSQDFDLAFPSCAGSDSTVIGFPGYTVSWDIAPAANVPVTTPPALYDVEVTVTREDLTYILASYLSCADAGEFSVTGVACPSATVLTP